MRKGTIDRPSLDELFCLNSWPINTVGYETDQTLIFEVKKLCDSHGYGRMHQLLEGIYDIWRNPDSVESYKKLREERIKMMAYKNSEEDNNGLRLDGN